MIYRDIWPRLDWVEIITICRIAEFEEFTTAFIKSGMSHGLVLEQLAKARKTLQ
jgi:hypothetical protein